MDVSGVGVGVDGPAGILLRLFQWSRLTFDISPHSGGLFGFEIIAGMFSGSRGVGSSFAARYGSGPWPMSGRWGIGVAWSVGLGD